MFKKSTTLLFVATLMTIRAAEAALGPETAAQMQYHYDTTASDCGGPAEPAHHCSGLLLRATKPSPNYHTWHHSPNSREKGGVSFTYLRADLPITALAADARSGFSLHPHMERPRGSIAYQVLCNWPTDGDTWTRDRQGCGDNSTTTDNERFCHEQGIDTAQAWIEHFRRTGDYKQQCAFDGRQTRGNERADSFAQALAVQRQYASELPFPWNEVIVQAWDEEQSQHLPIQSFFHVEGLNGALEQAQADQNDWYATYGTYVPIIRLKLPNDAEEKARFSYHPEEQAVPAS